MKAKVLAPVGELTHDEWIELRRNGIGGSDAGAILGVNRWKSPLTLWAEKTGKIKDEFQGNEATELGHHFEFPIAERYAKKTNHAIVQWNASLANETHPWQVGNIDFFIVEPSEQYPAGKVTVETDTLTVEPIAILEVKTSGLVGYGTRGWDNGQVPESYFWQGCHYSCVTGVKTVIFAALVASQGLQIREVRYTEDYQKMLTEAEAKFWEQVQKGIEPPTTGQDDEFDTVRALAGEVEQGKVVDANEFHADLVNEYVIAKQEVEWAEERLKAIRIQLEQLIGNAEEVQFNGSTLFTYKATRSGETLDTKALKEELPEIWQKYARAKSGYRVLRLAR